MHRSRPVMIVILATGGLVACSSRKESTSAGTLAVDSALVARVRGFQDSDKQVDKQADNHSQKTTFPEACGTFIIPTATAADKARARALAQRAYSAEILTEMKEANSLLRRASALDATDKSAAYHLGRVSEALGDRRSAIEAYCRYLALSPNASERAEVRQRVASLAATQAQAPAPSRRLAAAASAGATRGPKRSADATTIGANRAVEVPDHPRRVASAMTPPATGDPKVGRIVVDSDEVEVEQPLPPVERPRAESRGPSQIQSAGIGAIAGAIVGGIAGRNAKSTAIGAVAGGILGAVSSRETRRLNAPTIH